MEQNVDVFRGYANVNELSLYYEIHGNGEPLLLLHGGFGMIEGWGEVLGLLSKERKVIAVDLQGHGRTADVDRPLRFEFMADDIAALVKYLKLDNADIMGDSLGGGVALRTGIQHPEVVRKLVLVSTPYSSSGWYPEVLTGMHQMGPEAAEGMKQSPMYQIYKNVAPKPENWPVLISKMGELLRIDYDWSNEAAKLKPPTMIVIGDNDAIRPKHAVDFFMLLGGGKQDAGWDASKMSRARLAILPGLTHYNLFSSPVLPAAVTPFLNE